MLQALAQAGRLEKHEGVNILPVESFSLESI